MPAFPKPDQNPHLREEEQIKHRNKAVKKLTYEFDSYVYPKRSIDAGYQKPKDTLVFHHNKIEMPNAIDYTNVKQMDVRLSLIPFVFLFFFFKQTK